MGKAREQEVRLTGLAVMALMMLAALLTVSAARRRPTSNAESIRSVSARAKRPRDRVARSRGAGATR